MTTTPARDEAVWTARAPTVFDRWYLTRYQPDYVARNADTFNGDPLHETASYFRMGGLWSEGDSSVFERSILPVPSAARHAALEAAADALRAVLVQFMPEHIDAVSQTAVGTNARAALHALDKTARGEQG